ncbi:MAG: hypothetical protein ACFFDF_19945 [Candidatus Odinarchaeota archaeon]
MEVYIKIDTTRYEFLDLVQNISKNSVSIQKKLIKIIYENYDLQQIKQELDEKIAILDKLLIT